MKKSSMTEKILQTIYDYTKNYNDPSNNPLNEKNPNFQVIVRDGNVNISLSINPSDVEKVKELVNILKNKINTINGVLSVNVVLTCSI